MIFFFAVQVKIGKNKENLEDLSKLLGHSLGVSGVVLPLKIGICQQLTVFHLTRPLPAMQLSRILY